MKEKAEVREKAGARAKPQEKFPEGIQSRDLAAEKAGLGSGKTSEGAFLSSQPMTMKRTALEGRLKTLKGERRQRRTTARQGAFQMLPIAATRSGRQAPSPPAALGRAKPCPFRPPLPSSMPTSGFAVMSSARARLDARCARAKNSATKLEEQRAELQQTPQMVRAFFGAPSVVYGILGMRCTYLRKNGFVLFMVAFSSRWETARNNEAVQKVAGSTSPCRARTAWGPRRQRPYR